MNDTSMAQPRVLVPFAVATLIWSSTWIVIRDQLGVVPPSWSVTYRFATAAIALAIWAIATRQPIRLARSGHLFALLFGFAQFVLNFNFVYRAEAFITSGLVAVIFALLVIPNAAMGWLFLKQPVNRRFLVGSAVALAGVALLIVQEARADAALGRDATLGVLFTLCGVFSASAANIMQGSQRGHALPMMGTLIWGMVWGSAIDAAVAWALTGPPVIEPRWSYIAGVLYLGVFASAIAFTCYFSVIRQIGPARAAYSSVITPVLAMVLSTMFENYRWTGLAAAGGILAFAGLMLALSARKPAAKSG